MADDYENAFDPSLKKKKKKVRKIVDLDGSEEPVETAKSEEPSVNENTSVNEDTNKENEAVQDSQDKDVDDDMNFDDFSSMKKKKKKKKKKGFEDGQENTEGFYSIWVFFYRKECLKVGQNRVQCITTRQTWDVIRFSFHK
ncbi:Hypothetical predicted protein [Paramuricea clavata]|uniref:Uncharacterized protein n=1 Tax=Paramuricea clavata TaxID=317549 RepID=A0A6S7I9K3_PARCT|nr:Hypothetical predicted protein [Paramuricea clavata]